MRRKFSRRSASFPVSARSRPVTPNPQPDVQREKAALRRQALARRRATDDRQQLGERIADALLELPEFKAARTVMFYVSFRSEVPTRGPISAAIRADKRVLIPYCVGDRLELFLLKDFGELAPGTLGILEPKAELRDLPGKRGDASQLDLIVVPGLAFSRRGDRLGHGAGYYDKFLQELRPEVPLVAVAFECQMFARIPTEPHDVPIHKIVTETAVYECRPHLGSERN